MIKESYGFTFTAAMYQLMKLMKGGMPDPADRIKVYESFIEHCQEEIEKEKNLENSKEGE